MKEEQVMNGSKVFLLSGIVAMIGLMTFMTAPRLASSSILLSQLRGLTAAEMRADGGMARFEIVRDAGTLQCEGLFKNGRGSGTFVFKPNQNYVSEMRSLGYDNLSDDGMFSLALHDVRLDFVRGLIA